MVLYPETPLDDVPQLFLENRRSMNEDNDDGFQSVYVDSQGNEYEPYSMAWRYLGMYMDCEVDDDGNYYANDENDRRDLGSGSGDDTCGRKLLWAAYVDPRYQGGSIGEYQYYDPYTNTWDKSSCQTNRCAKMDCHDPHTHFKLIGVFKETYGLYDWGEQLFKHHGYCQWDEDTYDTMQDLLESWPQDGCQKLDYGDSDGNTLYSATKPLPEGNLTVALYYDEQCTVDSGMLWSDYIIIYYQNYYYYYYYYNNNQGQSGQSLAESWLKNIDLWNDAMAIYKICQPCRAYNLNPDEGSGSGSGSGDRRRFLGDDNDGGGEAEQWGYDCDDDAGYTNCNQCYKFETKTDMETAVKEDLQLASRQGTILDIRVNRTTYGRGGYRSPDLYPSEYASLFVLVAAVGIGLGLLVWKCRQWKKGRSNVVRALKEKLNTDVDFTASCAMAGLECQLDFHEQKPTASDPLAVDMFRFPTLKPNGAKAIEKHVTKALADCDDDATVASSVCGDESSDRADDGNHIGLQLCGGKASNQDDVNIMGPSLCGGKTSHCDDCNIMRLSCCGGKPSNEVDGLMVVPSPSQGESSVNIRSVMTYSEYETTLGCAEENEVEAVKRAHSFS